jgi:hypothetical protein
MIVIDVEAIANSTPRLLRKQCPPPLDLLRTTTSGTLYILLVVLQQRLKSGVSYRSSLS